MSLFFSRAAEQRSGDASWFGVGGSDSRTITPERAVHLAPVFAAIRHIVDFGATLPIECYRSNADGTRSKVRTLPPLLLGENATTRPGLQTWIGQAIYGLVSTGNAVGVNLEFNSWGMPSVVRWLRWQDWAYDEWANQWYVGGRPIDSGMITHIPWIVPPGFVLGLSPIEHYASIVQSGISAQEYADVKRGGGVPPAILKNNRLVLEPEQAKAVQDRAVKSFASGKPFVSGSDWDLTYLTIPPNQAQFLETLKLSANQIAAIYGIDPREIGGSASESLTYSTDESRALNRAANVRPYIERFEAAINRIIPEKQFIQLNVDATIRADIKTRIEVQGAQIKDGRMTVNEARIAEDREPIPQPEAPPLSVSMALDMAKAAPTLLQNPGLPTLVSQIELVLSGGKLPEPVPEQDPEQGETGDEPTTEGVAS